MLDKAHARRYGWWMGTGGRGLRWGGVSIAAVGAAAGACADVPDEPAGRSATSPRSQGIQRGVVIAPAEALRTGIVKLDGTTDPNSMLANRPCTATVIGPRVLLTAEHCVREHSEEKGWGALKAQITVSVPGTTAWSVKPCGVRAGTKNAPADADTPQAPRLVLYKKFDGRGIVLSNLLNRRLLFSVVPLPCDVATLKDPRADVAVVRLPPSAPAYPGWPTFTTLDGAPTSDYVDKGTRIRCVGYGLDRFHAPGEPDKGIAKGGYVRMVSTVPFSAPPPATGLFVIPPGQSGLLPYDPKGTPPGQLPDNGDSGGGCFFEPDNDVVERRIVGTNVAAYSTNVEGTPRDFALAARTDAFLPWVERAAYSDPNAFQGPVDTPISPSVALPAGLSWDDGKSLFSDVTGDGLDDFVYYGDPAKMYVQKAIGAGAFGPMVVVDEAHLPAFTTQAQWQGTNPAQPGPKGARTRIVNVNVVPGGGYPGLYFTTRLDDGTFFQFDELHGKEWESVIWVKAGPHFEAAREAVFVQRQPNAAVLGDTGAIVLMPGTANGNVSPSAEKIWKIPELYVGRSFTAADVDGDGGADLITLIDKTYHVLRAIKGGTWSTQAVTTATASNEGAGVCTLKDSDAQGIVDVTGDGRADLVCANSSAIFVRAGTSAGGFSYEEVTSPFEITGRPWKDAILQDLDGDGYRDYVTFYDGAVWFKLNNGPKPGNTSGDGRFGVVQRFEVSTPFVASFLANSFDAPRLRTTRPRSMAFVTPLVAGGPMVLREFASYVRADR